MYQRDYILRIIEQLGRALIELGNLIRGSRTDDPEAGAKLQALARQTGIDLDLVRAVNSEMLPLLVAPAGEPEPARCWFIAELLYLYALRSEREGRHLEVESDLGRALELYALLPADWVPPEGLPSAHDRIVAIQRWLGPTRDGEEGP